jgi:hypothetical protein
VEQLNAGAVAAANADVRVFKARPESNVAQSYGPDVAAKLAQAEPGKWLALATRDGWRAMRLVALAPATHARFEPHRDLIRQDFIAAQVDEKRPLAVQALWKKYEIEFAETLDCIADK